MVIENHPKVKRRSLGEFVLKRPSIVVLGLEGLTKSKVDFESFFSARLEGDSPKVQYVQRLRKIQSQGVVLFQSVSLKSNNFVRCHLQPTREVSERSRRSGHGEDEGWGQTWRPKTIRKSNDGR